MEKRQQETIEYLRREILLHDGLGKAHVAGYEYKEFEVRESESGLVFVSTVVGRKGDEGTLATLVRTRRHIAIGPKGGMQLLNGTRRVRGRKVTWWTTER